MRVFAGARIEPRHRAGEKQRQEAQAIAVINQSVLILASCGALGLAESITSHCFGSDGPESSQPV